MLWVVCVFLCVCARSLAVPVAGPRISSRSKVLLVSFDGFRWDYDRDVDTPHLDAMARDGVKAPYVTPAFITVTTHTNSTSKFRPKWFLNKSNRQLNGPLIQQKILLKLSF
uniref:Ectonucleotide pyrophosphatase/phosphodiesterase 7 n=1 Tax=Pygocentrus nattereri TaxID=42514 RepID=A0AAR2L1J6_PYGNA